MAPPQLKDDWADEDGWGDVKIPPPCEPSWILPDEARQKELDRILSGEAEAETVWKTKDPLWIEPSIEEDLEKPFRSFFCTKFHKIPSYLKVVDDSSSVQEEIALHSSRIPSLSYENIEGSVSYWVSYTLALFPESMWLTFRVNNCFKLGVEVAATLVYLLYPKEFVLRMVKYGETTEQLNRFWEQLVKIGNKGCPVTDACKLIIMRIRNAEYSLLNETHVSKMLFRYQVSLKNKSFRLPFTGFIPHEANFCPPPESLKEGLPIRSIYEVVEKMKPPAELKTDELTILLIKIAEQEVDKRWLFDFALERVVHTSHDSGTEWNRAFERLMRVILDTVRGMVNNKILNASSPLNQLIDSKSAIRVPHEVLDLLYVAEIRRLAEGIRFISRTHLLWAFYELGNGLPRDMLRLFTLPQTDHPPYDVYLISIKVAEFYGDKVRLENLLFVSLHYTSKHLYNLEGDKLNLMQAYKKFVLDLRKFSSNGQDPDGPMFMIDFPRVLQGIPLGFTSDC